ncbi:MAG: hypothetical protein ACOC1K_01610 [Nanoarchaeota archaeon]
MIVNEEIQSRNTNSNLDNVPEFRDWLRSTYGFSVTREQWRKALALYMRTYKVSIYFEIK